MIFGVVVCLNPGRFIISEGARLARPEYKRQRHLTEVVLRLAILAAVILLAVKLLGIGLSIVAITKGESLEWHDGQIVAVRGNWLSSWCYESVSFRETTSETSEYGVFFPPRHLYRGAHYRMGILPRTGLVVTITKRERRVASKIF